MFRLVLLLPFRILLVHKKRFYLEDAAESYRATNYPTFPGIEVWKDSDVFHFNGKTILFPTGA